MARSKFNKSRAVGGTRRVASLPCGKLIKQPPKQIKAFVQVHQKRCELCNSKDLSFIWKKPLSKTPTHNNFHGGYGSYGISGGQTMTAFNSETGEEIEVCRPVGMSPEQIYQGMRDHTLMDVVAEELPAGTEEEFKEVAIALKELGLCQELGITDDEFLKLMIDRNIF
jgi:hypothetical protein